MSKNSDKASEKIEMRYSSECLLSAERGFFSSRLELEFENGNDIIMLC